MLNTQLGFAPPPHFVCYLLRYRLFKVIFIVIVDQPKMHLRWCLKYYITSLHNPLLKMLKIVFVSNIEELVLCSCKVLFAIALLYDCCCFRILFVDPLMDTSCWLYACCIMFFQIWGCDISCINTFVCFKMCSWDITLTGSTFKICFLNVS